MSIVLVELKFNKQVVDKSLEALKYIESLSVEGRIRSEIFKNQMNGNYFLIEEEYESVMLYEEWDLLSHFEKHIKSDSFKTLLSFAETSITKPKIKIMDCGAVKGIPWIESVLHEEIRFSS